MLITAWLVLLGGLAVMADVWLAAGICSLIATGSWSAPSFTPVHLLLPLAQYGSGALASGYTGLFWTITVILAAGELVGALAVRIWLAEKLRGWSDPSRLARRNDLGDLAGKKAAKKARNLRPSLAGVKELGMNLGIRLMQVAGVDVWMSWEDVALIIMGPRSNKTSAIAVPTILSAPGPVVATSNKSDIWSLTASLRARVGKVRVFDPQLIAYARQTWYIDPVAWVRAERSERKLELAENFVSHFMTGVKGEKADPFFSNAAERVNTGTLLAAAANPNGTMRDVLTYLASGSRDAVQALDDAGARVDAEQLEETLGGAEVTAKGIFETARTAFKCLYSEALLKWVTPPHTWITPPPAGQRIEEFDPWSLFTGADAPTLYLLSKEGGGNSSPVVTALVARVTDVAERAAQARGGRLDPSLVLMLDEAANICPLASLPAQYSHWGSRGIQALTILQSYKQGARVWGREGMDALWSSATVKIAGAGIHDTELLRMLSELIGDHWVPKPPSHTNQRRGEGSEGNDMVQMPIMSVSRLAQLSKTESLLITPERPVAHGRLLPWYRESEDADGIMRAGQAAGDEVRSAAIDYLGPDNPVARALAAETGANQPQHAKPL